MFTILPPRIIARRSRFHIYLPDLLPWILLLFTYSLSVLFQAKYCDDLLNSDMAAEMLLAKELNDSGSFLFAKNWIYSTEIRALYQHIPFRLGLLLFPDNWRMARALGQAIMLALHAGSFIYMMSALGHKKPGIYGAAALMCPFGFWYTFYGIWGGMYLSYMIPFCITLGLIFDVLQCRSCRKAILLSISLTLLCFLQGMGGIRMLMNLFAPLCMTALILFMLQLNIQPLSKPFRKEPTAKLVILSIYTTIICFLGYLVNTLFLSQTYTYRSYGDQVWRGFSFSSLLKTWSQFITLFGYPYEQFAEWLSTSGWTEILLFSKGGILGAAGIVLMSVILFSIFRLFKLWPRLSLFHKMIALFLPICLFVSGISYSCLADFNSVNSSSAGNGSYYLPLVPITFTYVIIWILNEDFRIPKFFQSVIGILLFLCIFCTSLTSSYQFINHPPRAAIKMKAVGQWLVENGYHQGYATFWNSDVLTEHTDGRIEMWTLTDPTNHTIYPWLQTKDHLENPPEGKCFVLLDEYEYWNNIDSLPYRIDDDTIVFNEYGYIILSYDSIEDALK